MIIRSIFFLLLILSSTLLTAGYLGSYTARLSQNDHYSSRGYPLRHASDILQQDRANYHRFGLRDPEDTTDSYFSSRRHRARLGRMLRRGWIEPGLAEEIIEGTPLVKVDIYRRHIEVRRLPEAQTAGFIPAHRKQEQPAPARKLLTLTDLAADALARVEKVNSIASYGFNPYDHPGGFALEHQVIGVYPCRESGKTKAIVAVATNARSKRINHCHGCGVALSLFLYRHNGQTWILDAQRFGVTSDLGNVGSWGMPPEKNDITAVNLSPDNCALALIWGISTMGWSTRYYALFFHEADTFYPTFQTVIEEDNSGVGIGPKTRWESAIRIIPRRDTTVGPYDISIHRTGLKENRTYDYRVLYRKNKEFFMYRRQSPDPLAPKQKQTP